MLAQLNSKNKTLFFNIKPTVIDKLISKNKSSIQNTLLYTNEDSDGSLSEDSEESSSSSQDSNIVSSVQHSVTMAPIRRSEKVVLGSKVSSRSQFPIKRGPGRPSGRSNSTLKVVTAKKVADNSKTGSPKKVLREVRSITKVKRSSSESPITENVKRSRTVTKKENSPESLSPSVSESVKTIVAKGRTKTIKNVKQQLIQNKNPHTIPLNSQTHPLALHDIKSSPRKFPSNIVDRWKSTGMVIRGRGRPRGSTKASFRGGIRRGPLRSERYNTRDSQTGLMRSGKRRKCSDSSLIEGLDGIKKKKRGMERVKKEMNDSFSDQNSSFLTTSELSFYENENSLKQCDDEDVSAGLIKIKVEIDETEDETIEPRDSNSNVFKNDTKTKNKIKTSSSSSDSNGQSNNSSSPQCKLDLGPKKFGRGRKRLVLSRNKLVTQSDSSVKDSDCSLDSSDWTEENSKSPKQDMKRYKRKTAGGLWVRRSTRSIGKNVDKAESDAVAIEELLKEKDGSVNLECNSKSSLNTGGTVNDVRVKLEDAASTSEKNGLDNSTTEKSDEVGDNLSTLARSVETNEKSMYSANDIVVKSDDQCNVKSEIVNTNNESLVDFSLALEESPMKSSPEHSVASSSETSHAIRTVPLENILSKEPISFTIPTIDSSSENLITKSDLQEPDVETRNASNNEELDSVKESELCDSQSNNSKVLIDGNSVNATDKNVDLKKNDEDSSESITTKDDSIDSMFDEIDEKLSKQGYNDRDLVSDEKILSLIDSFCKSDSSSLPVNEENAKSSVIVNDNIEIKSSCPSNQVTLSAEDKVAENKCLEELSNTEEFICLDKNSKMSNLDNKPQSTLTEENGKVDIDYIMKPEDESAGKKLAVDISENIKTSFASIDINKKMSVLSNHSENSKIEDCFTNNMEIDLDNHDKVPESTEESSTSDSNSNLSELMSASLETDSATRTMTISEPKDESLTKTGDIPKNSMVDEEIINCTEVTVNERNTCSPAQCSSFTASFNLETGNQIGESNQSKLIRKSSIEGSTEERPSKELLSALGLQSLHSVEEKPKRPNDNYTGTLKAVIKLNRSDKKSGGRKMIFKQGDKLSENSGGSGDRLEYRICSTEELSTEGIPLTHLSDIPAHRKTQMKVKSQFDLSNSPNIVGSAGSMETTIDNTKETGGKQNLIIPEKSSSFSIHPERLCTDVCSYCFGKFGSLDTPCHLAQLKNSERQSKILAIEVHLSADSCLCDGCFRYVDRKANCPTSQRSRKPAARRGPLAGTVCAVQECSQPARHSVRRKWLIKLKKSIGKKLVIDMDKNPHLPIPLCSQHYYWVDYFTVCGICKKRLTRNHMYALGPEADDLNQALSDDGIPVRLSDKLFLCKLCRYYSSLRLKYRDPTTMSSTHRLFLNSYRKKILHYHDIPVSDSEEEGKSVEDEATTSEVPKAKKKKSKSKSFDGHESKKRSADKEEKSDAGNEERSNDSQMIDYSYLDSLNVHREEPTTPTVDYSSLGDFEGGFSNIASLLNPLEGGQGTVYPSDSQNRSRVEKPTRIQVKFGNLNIGKLSNLNIGQDTRPASTATPALERPPYLPGERDLNLSGEFEFHGTLNPISSWERCTSTIQFDRDTKKLWQELQRPYGNQSSFLRHLVILEKHWRNGSLVLADNPNPRAVKYINSVRNRVQAYDGAKSSGVKEDGKEPELNMASPPPRPMSTPVKVTSDPPPLMKITPGSSWLPNQLKRPPPYKFPVTSTQTTGSASGMLPATVTTPAPPPPPYRFPARPSQSGPRTMRMPCPSHSYIQSGRGQQNVRPVSISYHQFKKIRLEQPPPAVSTSQVTIIPKVEPVSQSQPTSTITSSETEFVPLICDVRSLATSTSTSDWNESFRKQQQKLLKQNVAKYYAPILPKMPSSLTVTTFPKTSGLVMKTSSLTIEKAPNVNTKPNIAPPEKPSISVFRETTPSENG
ncbi:hypothetical protein J6590_080409 [Homalodisca vitripennis]|nr:hypothetical protein J6590_080409 [Homalodisca vitripennis]